MPRKSYKYHYIYKTVCLINNKFYIGMHSTFNLKDDYLGSGKRLWYSIKKHGRENHKKEILEFLSDRIELKKREKEIIDEDFLKNPLCMNIQTGGEGGWAGNSNSLIPLKDPKYIRQRTENAKKTKVFRIKNVPEYKEVISKKLSNAKIKHDLEFGNNWLGKKHKEETKKKISNTRLKRRCGIGKNNSQYNTQWIYNPELKQNKKIFKSQLIPIGWIKGRKFNILGAHSWQTVVNG